MGGGLRRFRRRRVRRCLEHLQACGREELPEQVHAQVVVAEDEGREGEGDEHGRGQPVREEALPQHRRERVEHPHELLQVLGRQARDELRAELVERHLPPALRPPQHRPRGVRVAPSGLVGEPLDDGLGGGAREAERVHDRVARRRVDEPCCGAEAQDGLRGLGKGSAEGDPAGLLLDDLPAFHRQAHALQPPVQPPLELVEGQLGLGHEAGLLHEHAARGRQHVQEARHVSPRLAGLLLLGLRGAEVHEHRLVHLPRVLPVGNLDLDAVRRLPQRRVALLVLQQLAVVARAHDHQIRVERDTLRRGDRLQAAILRLHRLDHPIEETDVAVRRAPREQFVAQLLAPYPTVPPPHRLHPSLLAHKDEGVLVDRLECVPEP
mmetsp:Transcript_8759/g.17069  ORF Transcript_8759/g.17069 Transcript_8759/m.17069 type:complete len:379 (-) Transcript_8759:613-1749(-)